MANKNCKVLRLFGANISIVTTADDEPSPSYSRPATLEIVPFVGGGIMPSLLEEEDFQEHDQKGEKSYTVDDHVNTSSRLPIVGDDVDASRNCPMPLRCVPPEVIPEGDFWHGGYGAEISAADQVDRSRGGGCDGKRGKSAKRKGDKVGDVKKRRSVKRRRQNGNPIPSPEDIPGLVEITESRNGTRPVFVYQKKLEESDVRGNQNRLFMTRREELVKFLTQEEAKAVNDSKQGLQIVAVDTQRELYTLCLRIWPSLDMMVVNSDWNKLVIGNNAQKGDLIQIWGYRENGKPCFAINFRRFEAHSVSN